MKIGPFDTTKEVFVIAEIGVNHEGSEAVAERLIRHAAQAGAHAVKFQTFVVDNYVSGAYGDVRVNRLRKFALSFDAFRRLAGVARAEKILFMSTPLDLESARFLEPLVLAYKIASGDNDFYPLLKQLASTGKPLILSSGLADVETIRRAKSVIEGEWAAGDVRQELAVMHCVSSYPVPPEQANLASIQFLKERIGGTIGYSDHTLGCDAALMAVVLGARIIEKHFTLDKQFSEFRDHQLSATPEEMRTLVARIRETSAWLEKEGSAVSSAEK